MNHRHFFTNLFRGIIVSGTNPNILMSRSIDRHIWKPNRSIVKPIWTTEAEQNFVKYNDYSFNLKKI